MRFVQSFCIIIVLIATSCNSDTKNLDEATIIGSWNLEENCFSPGDTSLICNPPDEATVLDFFDDGRFELTIGNFKCTGNYTVTEAEFGDEIMMTTDDEGCTFGSNNYRVAEVNNEKLVFNWIGCIEPCISEFSRR